MVGVAVCGFFAGVTARRAGRGAADWMFWGGFLCSEVEKAGERVGVARGVDVVGNYLITGIFWPLNSGIHPLPLTLRLDGRAHGTGLTAALRAVQMLLAYFFAVASITGFAGLLFAVLLAHAVFADKVGATAVGRVTEVTFTAEDAVTLLGDIGVQRDGSGIGETSIRWRRKVFQPVEVAAGGVCALEDIFEDWP